MKLNVTKFWLEGVPVGSPMQMRDPSECLGRKAFAHTEASQEESTQVSSDSDEVDPCKLTNADERPFKRTRHESLCSYRGRLCTGHF